MENRQQVTKGCFTVAFIIFFGVPIFFIALIFIVYLFSKNILLGIIFCVALLLLTEAWKKRQKVKEQSLQQMVQNMSKMAEATAEENRKVARINRQKQAKAEKERLKKIPIWKRSGYVSQEEYLAEKERILRKKEQDYFLAKSYRQRQQRAKFQKNLKTIDDLFNLTPVQFEQWVKNNIFKKEGWDVEETKITGDGGIDLILKRNGEQSIAQCKRFKSTVGEPLLRDFYGAMTSEGVSKGYFVTTGVFTLQAQKFAEDKPIVLLDRRVLAQRLVS
jgi:restriction endonuclease Mrr